MSPRRDPFLYCVEITEAGVYFATNTPVLFKFERNTSGMPYMGSKFLQDREPRGVYLLHRLNGVYLTAGIVTGVAKFMSPLVVAFVPYGPHDYGLLNWKNRICQYYKTYRPEAITQYLKDDGYDAIVTVDTQRRRPIATSEIVALFPAAQLQYDA